MFTKFPNGRKDELSPLTLRLMSMTAAVAIFFGIATATLNQAALIYA